MQINTVLKEILFSTVRIVRQPLVTPGAEAQNPRVGTGFLISIPVGVGRIRPFLLTNKHVVDNAESLTLHFIGGSGVDNGPSLGTHFEHVITNPKESWVEHPDGLDIAMFPMTELIQEIREKIFFIPVPVTRIPPDGSLFLDAVEELLFVGYPSGRHDPQNFTPIVRRAITATPLELDYGGTPTFIVDGSVFGGSSGSPVFLSTRGLRRTGREAWGVEETNALVGIMFGTATVDMPVKMQSPQGGELFLNIPKELNLGVAYNWRAISRIIEHYHGSVPVVTTG